MPVEFLDKIFTNKLFLAAVKTPGVCALYSFKTSYCSGVKTIVTSPVTVYPCIE